MPVPIKMPFHLSVSTTARRYIKPSSKWHGVLSGGIKHTMTLVCLLVHATCLPVFVCAFCNSQLLLPSLSSP